MVNQPSKQPVIANPYEVYPRTIEHWAVSPPKTEVYGDIYKAMIPIRDYEGQIIAEFPTTMDSQNKAVIGMTFIVPAHLFVTSELISSSGQTADYVHFLVDSRDGSIVTGLSTLSPYKIIECKRKIHSDTPFTLVNVVNEEYSLRKAIGASEVMDMWNKGTLKELFDQADLAAEIQGMFISGTKKIDEDGVKKVGDLMDKHGVSKKARDEIEGLMARMKI